MTLTETAIQRVIRKLLRGQDYRIDIVNIINAAFLEYAIAFFKRVVDAKLRNESVTTDWYKVEFLDPHLPSDELIIHSGLNKKTVSNIYSTAKREVVLTATSDHYDQLYETINSLVETDGEVELTLTIKFRGVAVELNVNESLVIINTLAVKRAELRGGAWSTAGKQVEKILMRTLCALYRVPPEHYHLIGVTSERREVVFFLIGLNQQRYQCEVKLMGKGNPESADSTFARESDVFVADTLSDLNKTQLNQRGIRWVELRGDEGYRKFERILGELGIPHTPFDGNLDAVLPAIFEKIFAQSNP
jgi:hypothetical protein